MGYQALNWDYSQGEEVYSGAVLNTDITHQRQVSYLRGLGVDLVVDRMTVGDSNSHTYSVNWNFPDYFW